MQTNNKRVEILAPAGNFEVFKSAIASGCDALYIAGKSYGARAYANNFSNEELFDAIDYAHLYNVKVFVTVNTLIFEEEQYSARLENVNILTGEQLKKVELINQYFPTKIKNYKK